MNVNPLPVLLPSGLFPAGGRSADIQRHRGNVGSWTLKNLSSVLVLQEQFALCLPQSSCLSEEGVYHIAHRTCAPSISHYNSRWLEKVSVYRAYDRCLILRCELYFVHMIFFNFQIQSMEHCLFYHPHFKAEDKTNRPSDFRM